MLYRVLKPAQDRGIVVEIPLDSDTRTRLGAILDQLIPANPEKAIPAAGAAGTGDFIEGRCAGSEQIAMAVEELLVCSMSLQDRVTSDGVRQLEASWPESFNMLLRLTYMGYYSRPENRERVGVAARPVHPVGYLVDRESDDLLEELTSPVRARGSVYREV